MAPRTKELNKSEQRICVVCRKLTGEDILEEAALCLTALAQRFAQSGAAVTVLWIPKERPDDEEIKSKISSFESRYDIKVDLYDNGDETISYNSTASYISLGIYTYLKKANYTAVYIPLESGLAYYTLLGKETGVYDNAPIIHVIATAPQEWSFNADRFFYWSIDHLKIDYMEKYCAQQADTLICTSAPLRDWLNEKNWKLSTNCAVLPALSPMEWDERPSSNPSLTANGTKEIILVASPRFSDGITLFCDVLDHLNTITKEDLTITVLGGFYRILGEHTGGIFVRRGRRWKFRLRFLTDLTLRQGLIYGKEMGAVAVIANHENAGGYGVAECLRMGVPFVATAVGGNVEQAEFSGVSNDLTKPDAKILAARILQKLNAPVASLAKKFEGQKFQLWLKTLSKFSKPIAMVVQKKPSKSLAPLVSIIMTHHDRPQYFLQALASVREQDYPNFEVIIVDDGSALPESHAMLDGLKSEFRQKKWKIIKTENRYVGAARNTGVRASRGKFIVFLDDDNAFLPHTVSTFVAALTRSNSDVCTALSRNFYGHHVPASNRFNRVGWIPLGASPDVSFLESCFGDTISIYRRTVFNKVGFQLEKFGYMVEDYEFFVRIMLSNLKIRLIPEPLFWYRVSTQGRYRSSHFYDNQIPILEAFAKSKFWGLDNLYKLVLGQNISPHTKESYKANLRYSPSDRDFLELCDLDPNGDDAILLLAKLAAAESRPDTAIGLLSSLGVNNFESGLDDILTGGQNTSSAVMGHLPVFTSVRTLGVNDLLMMQVHSEEKKPNSYVEDPDQILVESVNGSLTVAVLAAGVPAHTISVSANVSALDSSGDDLEFILVFCPMYDDPVIAVQSARREQAEASSGWVPVSSVGMPARLLARFSTPSKTPYNLALGLRARGKSQVSAVGRFDSIDIKTALEEKVSRPRLGPSPVENQNQTWTDEERMSATLVTNYQSDLPQLLFPKALEDGIFIRPSVEGPVVASMHSCFPAFAKGLLGQVEIAHDEASPFEFAVALTLPDENQEWRSSGPQNAVAFSGWIKVEEKFKLKDISLNLIEQMNVPLTISIAVRLPRGSQPAPANAFWRNMKFFW